MVEVTLTFDNGPEPAVTPHVLDVLGDRCVPATFFVLGGKLAAPGGRAPAERAHAEGHWIGNHTFSHPAPFGEDADPRAARREIEAAQAQIGDLAHPDRLFRPVGGGGDIGPHLLTPEVVDTLVRGRYTCVLWTAVAHDWEDPDGWVERALARCTDGAVLVLHDLPTGAMDHLERFLDRAAAAGIGFRQEFPAAVVPVSRGQVVGDLGGLVGQNR